MGKIHIRGGSPLRLRFEDDSGTLLKVKLIPKKKWYEVENTSTKKKLQTKSGTKYNIFQVDAPHKTCNVILDYPNT